MSARWIAGWCLTLVGSGALADGPPVEEVGGVSLPGVGASVLAEEEQASAQPVFSNASIQTPVNIVVRPGVTELVPIARNYLNRIDTPFESPKLVTVNPIEFQKEGSAIFLTTSSEKPVGVHIVSNDPEDTRSISLALVARAIPPQTITLSWANQTSAGLVPAMRVKAQRWEEATPYEETLYRLAEHVARGEIPEGYSLAEAVEPLPCQLPGVEFYTGQRLTGAHFSVFVLRATNTSRSNLEILAHAGCNVPGVRLVAPWPRAHLAPGESTELFVAVTNETYEPPEASNYRPSLLDASY